MSADETLTEKLVVRISPAMLRAVDDHRFDRRISSRGEAVRQLLAVALVLQNKGEKVG